MSRYLVHILLLYLSTHAQCWTNYKLNFLATKLLNHDSDLISIHNWEIKKLNRSFGYLFINATVLEPLNDIVLELQVYQCVSNRFKESLIRFKSNLCRFLNGGKIESNSGLSGRLLSKMQGPFREILYGPGQKFPNSCPVIPDTYCIKAHVDETKFPAFLLPAGKWKAEFEMKIKEKSLIQVAIVYEIVNYLTEKQKNRLS